MQPAGLSSFEYTYDLDGLRTKVTRENGDYVEYDYDGLSRLTDEHCKNAQGQTQWRRQYQYDKVGNRTQLIKTDGATSRTYYYWYNGLGQLETMRWNVNGPEWYCHYTYDANGNLTGRTIDIEEALIQEEWTYDWDAQDRLVRVEKDDQTQADEDRRVEYKYCQTCGGAMSERIEYASDGQTIVSWLRYEYDGLNLLRIDERYDGETPAGLDENDPWRPLNVFIHGPGAIGQIVKCKWYNYYSDGQNPTNCCDSGEYYYFYDALGNVNGVLDSGGHYYRWEMDAFGNDLPGGNAFLPMDQPGPKEHLTGKMYDTVTGLYYFQVRWYDPQVGRFLSTDPVRTKMHYVYCSSGPNCIDPIGLKDYKLGVSDPPIPPYDPGAGVHGSLKATAADHAAKLAWITASNAARLRGWNNAADHFNHFLNNSGTMYTIDLDNMIASVASARRLMYDEMNMAMAFAETLKRGTRHAITSGAVSGGYNWKSENADWYYAVGGYFAWGKGVCCCGPTECSMSFEYKFADMYNWDKGKGVKFGPIPVPDTAPGRLHLVGIAQEFEMKGSTRRTLIWRRGGRF